MQSISTLHSAITNVTSHHYGRQPRRDTEITGAAFALELIQEIMSKGDKRLSKVFNCYTKHTCDGWKVASDLIHVAMKSTHENKRNSGSGTH